MRYRLLTIVGSLCLILCAHFAWSQEGESKSAPAEIKGCLSKGVEAGCLVLTTLDGKTYSLHGSNLPGLDKKLVVSVKGTAEGVDACMQGTVVKVSSWHWTRMMCKQPKPAPNPPNQ